MASKWREELRPAQSKAYGLLMGAGWAAAISSAAKPDAAPKVTGYTCRITEQGPLFVEATVRYTFTHGGWYEFTARVLAGDPAVRVDEQFDMGCARFDVGLPLDGIARQRLEGWRMETRRSLLDFRGEQTEGRERGRSYAAKMRELGLTNAPDCASGAIRYDEPFKHLFDMAVRYPYHPNAYFFGLVNTADLTTQPIAPDKVPFLAVVPMHTGNWRGSTDPMDAMLFSYQLGDLCLNWRLLASPHPRTMLHTGEYDPDQPLTFCRRQWALIGGGFQPFDKLWTFRAQEGCVTLDDYKDWVLDWPTDPNVTYPRLLFGRADVERLKPELDQLPDGKSFRQYLYVNETDKRREELWDKLTGTTNGAVPLAKHVTSSRKATR